MQYVLYFFPAKEPSLKTCLSCKFANFLLGHHGTEGVSGRSTAEKTFSLILLMAIDIVYTEGLAWGESHQSFAAKYWATSPPSKCCRIDSLYRALLFHLTSYFTC